MFCFRSTRPVCIRCRAFVVLCFCLYYDFVHQSMYVVCYSRTISKVSCRGIVGLAVVIKDANSYGSVSLRQCTCYLLDVLIVVSYLYTITTLPLVVSLVSHSL